MSNPISKLVHNLIKKLLYIRPLDGELCTSIIKSELKKDRPAMIARFGSTEIKAILYPSFPFYVRPFVKKRIFGNMRTLSGFFPSNEETIRKFSKMMLEDMQLLDVLGSWRVEERFLQKHFSLAKRIKLSALEPYLQRDPWSEVLENKKVLVIHPFNSTIESQYFNKREHLFTDKRVLPQFKSFETIRAVQTIADTDSDFSDWFSGFSICKLQNESNLLQNSF
jgi:hypothetical protein